MPGVTFSSPWHHVLIVRDAGTGYRRTHQEYSNSKFNLFETLGVLRMTKKKSLSRTNTPPAEPPFGFKLRVQLVPASIRVRLFRHSFAWDSHPRTREHNGNNWSEELKRPSSIARDGGTGILMRKIP